MKTVHSKKKKGERNWHLLDAKGEILGRFASQVALLLMGKHRTSFSYHLDQGDNVVVINASRIRVTGNKLKDKLYQHYTGYPGGIKEISLKDLKEKNPKMVIEKAVWGMLPKNKLRKKRMTRLKVYKDDKHPYAKMEFVKAKDNG
ncbi:MAG: 50S ribosomal protein L13 [Candidatus Shapirobacteria bacterium]